MNRKLASLVLGACTLALFSGTAFAQQKFQLPPTVMTTVQPATVGPLRDMANLNLPSVMRRIVGNKHYTKAQLAQLRKKLIKTGYLPKPGQKSSLPPVGRPPAMARPPVVRDPVLQSKLPGSGGVSPRDFTAPLASFDGMGVSTNGSVGSLIPHTSVAAGVGNYVMEMVTLSGWPSGGSYFTVYDKSGNKVMGPVNLDNLWPDDECNSSIHSVGFGQGQVIYDQLAQRWILVQIAGYRGNSLASNECVAVSQTGDPSGTYYVYDFPITVPNPWPIFHYFIRGQSFGLWSNAYFASFNLFENSATQAFPFSGVAFVALQRSAMLAGRPAQMIMIKSSADDSAVSMLPATLDGENPPPAGAPGLFAGYVSPFQFGSAGYALDLWQMSVDWANPADSTLTGPTLIKVAPFNDGICYVNPSRCIPEPAPGIKLSAVANHLMPRLAYRNLGDRQALVVNQTVAGSDSGEPPAGIRWYELDAPTGSVDASQWSIAQQGTYLPADGKSRWIGSIAMDSSGDIALGYSLSGPNTYPSIAYTGRLSSDPTGKMTQRETILQAGSGVETSYSSFPNWGDISTMATDPSDGCTFWYAGEFLTDNDTYNWSTHIGAFKFANCTAAPTGTLTGTVTDAGGNPVVNATVAVGNSPNRVQTKTDGKGRYTILLPAGSYPETATRFAYASQSATVTITKGSTTTQDFTLTAAPTATVSGKVNDASGHGWGLYAQIKISTPGFGQVADVWTVPGNGKYSIKLPQGGDYSLAVTPYFDGYNPGTATVTDLSGNTTQNFPLTITAACAAPGYHSVGFGEDFNGSFPPAGWKVINTGRSEPPPFGYTWATNTDYRAGNWTGGTGTAASAGPISFSFGTPNTSLITPPIPVTSLPPGRVKLSYKANYIHGFADALDLGISTDGGSSWTTISHWTTTHGTIYGTPGVNVSVNLAGFLPASGDFQLRWYYHSRFPFGNWYAQIDDVSMTACKPVAGGLVLGQVSDKNTGVGLVGATVTDAKGASTKTFSNPSDANLPVGYYLMFLPSGKHALTASHWYYSKGQASLNVGADSVTRQNFKLAAGRLSGTPEHYELQVTVGSDKSKALAVKNTGSASAHFRVETINAPFSATAAESVKKARQGEGAPPLFIPCTNLSPLSYTQGTQQTHCVESKAISAPQAASSAWQAIADYPFPIMDNAVAIDPAAEQHPGSGEIYSVDGTDGKNVLTSGYAYDPNSNTWHPIANNRVAREAPVAAFIDGKLYLAGGWGNPTGRLEIFLPASNTWTAGASDPVPLGGGSAAAVVNGKLYVVGGCNNDTGLAGFCGFTTVMAYDPGTNGWTQVADYPHPVSWEACGGIGKAGQQKLYCAGGTAGQGTNYRGGYVYDPATNRWSPIANMPNTRWGAGYAVANGELLVSGGVVHSGTTLTNTGYAYNRESNSWHALPNSMDALFRGGSACGFYRIGGSTGGISPVTSDEVLPSYGQCGFSPIPWLNIAPPAGTVAAGASVPVTLTFDGTARKPFTTSQAQLLLIGNTPPYPTRIPLTVHWEPQPVHLVLSGSASPSPVSKGDVLAYALTVQNAPTEGSGAATETALTYSVPAGVSYLNGSGNGVSCTPPPSSSAPAAGTSSTVMVSCNLGTIPAGTGKDVTITVRANRTGVLASTFAVSAREPDSDTSDNTLTLTTSVRGTADLTASATGANINKHAFATLHFTVGNNGPDAATDVKLKLSAGSAANLSAATPSQGSCASSGANGFDCDLGEIAPGATVGVDIQVVGAIVGTSTLIGQVASTATDPNEENNVAQATIVVSGGGGSNGGGGGFGGLALALLFSLALVVGLSRRRAMFSLMLRNHNRRAGTMSYGRMARTIGIAILLLGVGLSAGTLAQAGTRSPNTVPQSGFTAWHGTAGSNRIAMKPQSSLALLQQATLVGPHAASSAIDLTIGLKLRNVSRLAKFLRAVQNPKSPLYHQFLTPQEFTAEYGPTKAQVATVTRFLEHWGIHVENVSSNRILIHTSGSTTDYEHAFQIMINDYRLNGRSFFSTKNSPRIPTALAGVVANVIGLNRAVELKPHHHVVPHAFSSPSAAAEAPPPVTTAEYYPAQTAQAYDWPSITNKSNGAGVTVAIMTSSSSNLNPDDYETFWSELGLPGHKVQTIPVDGDEGITSGTVETVLDVELSGAMAPGAALKVYVSADPLLTTFMDLYNRVITDDDAQTVTTSWGAPEPSWGSLAKTANAIFEEGAALGMSIFAASGDNGSGDCFLCPPTADFPSASPYVTAANGTELKADIKGNYISETAWNLTGGSVSQIFAEPDWQVGPGVPRNGFRNNSDIAMNAGGEHPYWIHFEGIWGGVYGTSAVAPQLAALFAVAVSQNGGDSLGQANKLIYDDVNAGHYASDFHDVTTGCNGILPDGKQSCAKVNWDHPTGWGSPKATSLLSHLGVQGPAGTLSGTITDAATGQPIAGAYVLVTPDRFPRKTKSDGAYSYLLPVGDYTVTVQDFGYATQSVQVHISDGGTMEKNFQLAAAPTAVVSGKVSDASGHGYGLYAEVVVTAPNAVQPGPVAVAFTDPETGDYSVKLPQNNDYAFEVLTYFDGYEVGNATIKSLSGDVTQNFPLTISTACTAPGYRSLTGLTADFNIGVPPTGWQVTNDVSGSPVVWATNGFWEQDNWTGGTGTSADVNSGDSNFYYGHYDTSLITPPVAVSALRPNPILYFKLNYQNYKNVGADALDVDISTDGGSTWTRMVHYTTDQGHPYHLPGVSKGINLRPYVSGARKILLRWRYYNLTGGFNWYAQVDDVRVGGCEPISGGLVAGQVTDQNTGKGLDRAEVADDTGAHTTTFSVPPDASLPIGSYILFVPSGPREISASYENYATAKAAVNVAANSINVKSFALAAARISSTPKSYHVHVTVGSQKTLRLAIGNTGQAKAKFWVKTINAPAPETLAGLQKLGGTGSVPKQIIYCKHLSPFSWVDMGHADCRRLSSSGLTSNAGSTPWVPIAEFPVEAIIDNAVAIDPPAAQRPGSGRVYSIDGNPCNCPPTTDSYAYDPSTNSWSPIANNKVAREGSVAAFIGGKLYLVNGWDTHPIPQPVATLEIYNPGTNTWSDGPDNPVPHAGGSAVAVMGGKLYVVGGCGPSGPEAFCGTTTVEVYDPVRKVWTSAAPYPHKVAWAACGAIGFPGSKKLYCAGGMSSPPGSLSMTTYADAYVYDPDTNQWSPIAGMPTDRYGAGYAVGDGKLLISGGAAYGGGAIVNTGFAYDPASNSWLSLPNSNYSLYRGGSACGFYRIGGSTGGFTPVGSSEVLPGLGPCGYSPIPWLTLAPPTGTVAAAPAASAVVALTIDGSGQQPFTSSHAQLVLLGETPYGKQIVPLNVTWDPKPVNLVLTGSAAPDPVNKGNNLAYSLTVENVQAADHGPATATILSYVLPAGASYVSGGGDGVSCAVPPGGSSPAPAVASAPPTGAVICDFGTLTQGALKTATIVVQPNATGTLTSVFSVAAREPDSDTSDNSLTLSTSVIGTADLAVSTEDTSIFSGASGTVHFEVVNAGPDSATGVTLKVTTGGTLLTLQSATASQGSCKAASGGAIECNLGTVAAGGSVGVDITAYGASLGEATVIGKAATSANDSNAGNNLAQATVTVTAKSSSGGGALGWLALAALLGLAFAVGIERRRRNV